MPEKTISAFGEHGRIVDDSVEQGMPEAERVMRELARLRISFEQVTARLENEGIQKFIEAFDEVLGRLAEQRDGAVARARDTRKGA